jgi:nitrate/TMAO reductase-like tetraheme cytochrome c subunit
MKLSIQNKKLRYWVLGFTGIIAAGIVLFGMVEVTSTPTFCSSCHYMQPYIDAWQTSSHKDVTCIKCHFPPGIMSKIEGKFTAIAMVANYATGVYKRGKPHADIPDASCLRSGCHSKELLRDSLSFKGRINFGHSAHLTGLRNGKQLRCTSCHSQIVQGEHIVVTESTCFLCHFKEPVDIPKLNNCSTCHRAPVTSVETPDVEYDHTSILERNIKCESCHGDMHNGTGAAPIERCSTCHADTKVNEVFNRPDSLHQLHITQHKIECLACHMPIQHKSVARSEHIVPQCESCHQNTHVAQLDLFTGKGAIGFEAHPNPMFESGLNCQACHVYHSELNGIGDFGVNNTANYNSCEVCHGEGYNRILNQWQKQMAVKMDAIEKSIRIIETHIDKPGLSEKQKSSIAEKMSQAKHNFGMVKSGNVIHNISFSDKLLFSTHEDLKTVAGYLGVSKDIQDFNVLHNDMIPSDCNNCHYGIEDVETSVFNLSFKHKQHVVEAKMKCAECHSNRAKHGEMVMNKNECLSCHHEDKKKKCETCHTTQNELRSGTIDLGTDLSADYMHGNKITCRKCHETENGTIQRTNRLACVKCHSAVYPQFIEEWKIDTKRDIKRLNDIIAEKSKMTMRASQEKELNTIRSGLEKLEKEGSFSVHNPKLVRVALEYYNNRLNYLRN